MGYCRGDLAGGRSPREQRRRRLLLPPVLLLLLAVANAPFAAASFFGGDATDSVRFNPKLFKLAIT